MSGGKKITSYSLSPEAEGMIESVPNNIASIINTIVVIVLTSSILNHMKQVEQFKENS